MATRAWLGQLRLLEQHHGSLIDRQLTFLDDGGDYDAAQARELREEIAGVLTVLVNMDATLAEREET